MKYLSLCLLMLASGLKAQEHQWNLFPGGDTLKETEAPAGEKIKSFDLEFNGRQGEVKVVKDERIQELSKFVGEPQRGEAGVTMKGYRVQVFFDTDKDLVNQKRADYLARHDDNPAYIDYKQPNFRLRVGNFRTRLQAQQWQDEIKMDFPDAIIIEDWINLPALRTTDEAPRKNNR